MLNFAHNGIVHESMIESTAHSLADYAMFILTACAFATGLVVVYFYLRKRFATVQIRNKNEKE